MQGPLLEAGRRLRIPEVDVGPQSRLVLLAAAHEERGGQRHSHAAPQVAKHVESGGGVAELVAGDGGQGQGHEGHEDEAEPQALDEAGHGERPVVHGQRQVRHHEEADRVDQAAAGDEDTLVHPRHQAARDDQRDQVPHSARPQDGAGVPRVVGHELLRVEGDEEHARVEPEPHHHDERRARGEVPVGEDAQIEDGLARRQLADDEAEHSDHGHHREGHDQGGVEPVLVLAAVEDELETTEPHHHEHEPERVDAPRLLEIGRVEEEGADHDEAEEADGQVDVEDPAPGPVVRDPPAQRRPEDGPHHDADAPDGHGEAALAHREDLPQDGLGQRDQGPAPNTLEHPCNDEKGQVGGQPREEGADREDRGADQKEPAAPDVAREPSRGGDDDGVGGQIGGDDPGHFLHAGRQRALHVREDHVGDAGVDDLHHRDQHGGERDEPLLRSREFPDGRRRHAVARPRRRADSVPGEAGGLPRGPH